MDPILEVPCTFIKVPDGPHNRGAMYLYQSFRWAPIVEVPCTFIKVPDGPHTRGALYLYQSSRWTPYLDLQHPQGTKKERKYVKNKTPSNSPVRQPPSIFIQQGPYGVKCYVSRANGLFIHLYPS